MQLREEEKLARFEQAILPHFDAAYNLARWLTREGHDAEDVVQEAYLRAYKFFDRFRGGDGRGWLLAIVRNPCYTWLKNNRPRELATPLGGPLGEGRIQDGCITCPWHGWQYSPHECASVSPAPPRPKAPNFPESAAPVPRRVARVGPIDIRRQADVPSARRSDTPRAIRLSALRSPV
jgi:RNA polymerase sigma factor (sigma-70 family)